MKTMKNWRKVLLQALFYFCSFMAIIWLLNMVFSDGIDDWKGEIIKGSLYTVTITYMEMMSNPQTKNLHDLRR